MKASKRMVARLLFYLIQMKKLFLLITLLLSFHNVWGYDAEVNGIFYNLNTENYTATVTYKGSNPWEYGGYTGNIVIPEKVTVDGTVYSVTSLGDNCFNGCYDLTSISIPNSVTSIGEGCFWGCSLPSITIPESVTSLGFACLSGCLFESIIVAEGNPVYDSRENCNAIIETSTNTLIAGCENTLIPESVTSLGDRCFSACGLTSITIPKSVTSLGAECFYLSRWLTSITIPNSVTSLGEACFYDCSSLISISIPNSVTDLGNYCFMSCSSLKIVTCEIPSAINNNNLFGSYIPIEKAALYVPEESLESYQTTYPWYRFGTINAIPTTTSVVVGSTGLATYCSPFNLDFSDVKGLNAYIASGYNAEEGKITMTRVKEIPANTGFILKGSAGAYTIPVKSTEATFENLLMGTVVDAEVSATDNGYDNYILGNGEKGVAFYKSSGGTLAANKAYLRLPASESSSAKAIRMSFDDDATTEILLLENENTEETVTSPVYDLNGMQKSGISNGWNIVNGKKILIKK